MPLDRERVKKICKKSRAFAPDYVRSAANILHAVASFVILERMAALREDRISTRLDSYLRENFSKKLTAEDICRQLEITIISSVHFPKHIIYRRMNIGNQRSEKRDLVHTRR